MAELKSYQLEGLAFLVHLERNGVGGILGDEMGLGKTIQTLALFQYLRENADMQGQIPGPFLVVCPLSVLTTWAQEVAKWVPHLTAFKYYGSQEERRSLRSLLSRRQGTVNQRRKRDHSADKKPVVDIIITTYDQITADLMWFQRTFDWRCIVLDEGHRIKNHLTRKSQALQKLKTGFKLVLTG